MLQEVDSSSTRIKRKRIMSPEEVAAQHAQGDQDPTTADLAPVIADLAGKREELESFINKSKDLENALKKNAAERQRLIAEYIALGGNGDISVANPKVAASETKVAALEAKITRLETDLEARQQETIKNRQKKHLATQQIVSFLLANDIKTYPNPDMTEAAVRAMIAAEPPQTSHDSSGHVYWRVLPLRLHKVRLPQDIPETECAMVLKLHSLVSNISSGTELASVSDILALISNLLPRLPPSRFYAMTAIFKDMLEITADAPIGPLAKSTLAFSIYQLGSAMCARFGKINADCPVTHLSFSGFWAMHFFKQALDRSDRGAGDELVVALYELCDQEQSLRFCYEKSSNRGWMTHTWNHQILLIDFNERSLLIVSRFLCSLRSSNTAPEQVDLRIEGTEDGDEGTWIRNLAPNARQWLGSWACVN